MNEIQATGTWNQQRSDLNRNFEEIQAALLRLKQQTSMVAGYFLNKENLDQYKNPQEGMMAYVGLQAPYQIYQYHLGLWVSTTGTGGNENADLDQAVTSLQAQTASLLRRITGTDTNSSAETDPFISLGAFASFAELQSRLDAIIPSSGANHEYCGRWRASLGGARIEGTQYVREYAAGSVTQTIEGNIALTYGGQLTSASSYAKLQRTRPAQGSFSPWQYAAQPRERIEASRLDTIIGASFEQYAYRARFGGDIDLITNEAIVGRLIHVSDFARHEVAQALFTSMTPDALNAGNFGTHIDGTLNLLWRVYTYDTATRTVTQGRWQQLAALPEADRQKLDTYPDTWAQAKQQAKDEILAQIPQQPEADSQKLARAYLGSTARFDGFVRDVQIQASSATDIEGVYYDVAKKTFCARDAAGTYHNNWDISGGSAASMFVKQSWGGGSTPLKDKLYLYGSTLWAWSDAQATLIELNPAQQGGTGDIIIE